MDEYVTANDNELPFGNWYETSDDCVSHVPTFGREECCQFWWLHQHLV
jgi:hypothetical protein